MRASQPLADPVPTIPLEPIPPARVALVQAIECLDSARERLDEGQKAVAALEQLRPAASARQTSALHAEIGRLCEITNRLDAGAEGIRPSLPKGARALRDFCLPIRPMELRLLWPEPGNKVLLRPAGRLLNRGIDVMMAIAYPNLRAFVSVPPLVISQNEHFRSATQRDVFLAEMFRGRGNAGTNSPPNAERSS